MSIKDVLLTERNPGQLNYEQKKEHDPIKTVGTKILLEKSPEEHLINSLKANESLTDKLKNLKNQQDLIGAKVKLLITLAKANKNDSQLEMIKTIISLQDILLPEKSSQTKSTTPSKKDASRMQCKELQDELKNLDQEVTDELKKITLTKPEDINLSDFENNFTKLCNRVEAQKKSLWKRVDEITLKIADEYDVSTPSKEFIRQASILSKIPNEKWDTFVLAHKNVQELRQIQVKNLKKDDQKLTDLTKTLEHKLAYLNAFKEIALLSADHRFIVENQVGLNKELIGSIEKLVSLGDTRAIYETHKLDVTDLKKTEILKKKIEDLSTSLNPELGKEYLNIQTIVNEKKTAFDDEEKLLSDAISNSNKKLSYLQNLGEIFPLLSEHTIISQEQKGINLQMIQFLSSIPISSGALSAYEGFKEIITDLTKTETLNSIVTDLNVRIQIETGNEYKAIKDLLSNAIATFTDEEKNLSSAILNSRKNLGYLESLGQIQLQSSKNKDIIKLSTLNTELNNYIKTSTKKTSEELQEFIKKAQAITIYPNQTEKLGEMIRNFSSIIQKENGPEYKHLQDIMNRMLITFMTDEKSVKQLPQDINKQLFALNEIINPSGLMSYIKSSVVTPHVKVIEGDPTFEIVENDKDETVAGKEQAKQ